MLIVIRFCSPPYSASASASAVSVLPTPDGPHSRNTPIGLRRIVEPGARRLHPARDHLQRVVLADHALAQRLRQPEHRAHLVRHHPADRDAGPVLHHRRHRLLVDARQDQRRLALGSGKLRLQRRQLRQHRLPRLPVGTFPPQRRAQCEHPVDQRLLGLPARLQLRQRRLLAPQRLARRSLACGNVDADRALPPDDRKLGLERLDAPAAILHRRRHRVLADRDARAAVSSRLTDLSGSWPAGM